MNRKKILAVLGGIVLALAVSGAGVYVYAVNHPQISFDRGTPVDYDAPFYITHLGYNIYCYFDAPLPERIQTCLDEFQDWGETFTAHLYETYTAPTRLVAYAEVKDNKTRFWYEGTATTKDGETVPYFEEKVFDWVLVPDEALADLKEPPAPPDIYENRALGFRLKLPAQWKGQYEAVSDDSSPDSVILKPVWGGSFCTIYRKTAEEWAAEGTGDLIPARCRVLGESDAYVYLMYFNGQEVGTEEEIVSFRRLEGDLSANLFVFEVID